MLKYKDIDLLFIPDKNNKSPLYVKIYRKDQHNLLNRLKGKQIIINIKIK